MAIIPHTSDLVILIICSLPCLVSIFIAAYAVLSLRYHCKLLELKILEKDSPNDVHAQPLASVYGAVETLQGELDCADPNDHVAPSDSASNHIRADSEYVQTGFKVEQVWSEDNPAKIQSPQDPAATSFIANLRGLDTDYALKSSQIKALTKLNQELQVAREEQEDKILELTLELLKCRRRLHLATNGPPDAIVPNLTKEELHIICIKQEQKILELNDKLSEYHHILATGRSLNSESAAFLPPSPLAPPFNCSCNERIDVRLTRSAPVSYDMLDMGVYDVDQCNTETQKGEEGEEVLFYEGSQSDRVVHDVTEMDDPEDDSTEQHIRTNDEDGASEYTSVNDEDESGLFVREDRECVEWQENLRARKARRARTQKVRRLSVRYSKRSGYHRA